ncbi:MAG: DUF1573 domain-containing protein [Bacteroidales bacterium]|nr:DUF1573 domain-containing protein [Bacteroidales bacterium]
MGKKLLVIAIILGLCHSISAQSSSTTKDDSSSHGITFNKTIHNFGKLIQDDPAGCEFIFYNKGRSPIIISDITASCGCTVPSWSKKPVMPGDSGSIQVLYLTNAPGTFEKEITVFSNATKEPLLLKIKGKVIRK